MTEAFESIPSSTLLCLAALFLYLFTVRKVTSFSFVFVGILVLEALHIGIQFALASLVHTPELVPFVYYTWYLSYGLTDFFFVGVVFYLCRRSETELEFVSKLLLWIYLSLGVLQVVRLIERLTINSDIVGWLYTSGVPIVNFGIALILLGYVIKVIATNLVLSFRTL